MNLKTVRSYAKTGVDFISRRRSHPLHHFVDLSMRIIADR